MSTKTRQWRTEEQLLSCYSRVNTQCSGVSPFFSNNQETRNNNQYPNFNPDEISGQVAKEYEIIVWFGNWLFLFL